MADGGRLILVDDEPVILQLLSTIFADDRFALVACPDGRSALEAIEEGCDVLLTDKNLPDVGGLELVRRAKARWPDSEAIILTGYASLDTALEAMELEGACREASLWEGVPPCSGHALAATRPSGSARSLKAEISSNSIWIFKPSSRAAAQKLPQKVKQYKRICHLMT